MALWRMSTVLRRGLRVCAALRTAASFEVESEREFQERVLQADQPVLVDFHARSLERCAVCRS